MLPLVLLLSCCVILPALTGQGSLSSGCPDTSLMPITLIQPPGTCRREAPALP